MNIIDQKCIDLFPELVEIYGRAEIIDASKVGIYIIHEDYLNEFVSIHGSPDVLKRVSLYLDELCSSEDPDARVLAQIGVLEGLISRGVVELAPFLSPNGREMVKTARDRLAFDLELWLTL